MRHVREWARSAGLAVSTRGVLTDRILEAYVAANGPDEEVEQQLRIRSNRKTTEERFWEKVDVDGDCWLWIGARSHLGYGRFKVDDDRGVVGAHRVSYEMLVGKIPTGYALDHLCRVPRCVNPDHLDPVPQQENLRRGYSPMAQLSRRTACRDGHPIDGVRILKNGTTKRYCRQCEGTGASSKWSRLTTSQVAEIRTLYRGGGTTAGELAARFDVHVDVVEALVNALGRKGVG